ncbi:MAG: dTDP-4-dehydrorhamnose 3,5-epimerase family protein [Actinomycetota bacterium]|nr:dTDP-4-dehydrorhamnose 3,5-epimerase family protein [Actinomycetota bacterium]
MSAGLLVEGVMLTELAQIVDERGAVLHHMRCDATDFVTFGESYFSEMIPGAVKAWKRHRSQTQHLAVPVGRVRFVIYDDRKDSPSNGSLDVVELGRPDHYNRLRIPNGLWYGFTCLSEGPALIANCADRPHDPEDAELRPDADPYIPYRW